MSRKSTVENARRFLWDEEDSAASGRTGRTSHSAGVAQSRGGFSTRDFAVDQTVNLMAMGEDPVRGAAGVAGGSGTIDVESTSSRFAGLFRATTGTEGGGGRFDEYGDAAPSADAEEYISDDKRRRIAPLWSLCANSWNSMLDCCTVTCGRVGGPGSPRLRIVLVCLLVGVCLLAGGIYAALSSHGSSNNPDYQSAIDRLVNSGIATKGILNSKSPSPQKSALEWIIKENMIGSDHEAFLDRYTLAVFYFSSRNAARGGWIKADNWMTEKGICSWYGVECLPREQEATEVNNYSPVTRTYDDNARITAIKLSDNGIEGVLPIEFGLALDNLETLDLQNNVLSHTLPSTMGRLTNLRTLLLRGNQLVGPLISQIGALNRLHQLHLANNEFEGTVPKEWAGLEELRSFSVSHNLLTGTFPDMSQMPRLMDLYLDDNDFEGSLPAYLEELTDLLDLRLGQNKFAGSISAVSGLQNLEILHLNDNNFESTIPNMFDRAYRLHEIFFQGNKFSGQVPRTLTHLQGLKILNLSNNTLTGTIPAGLGLLTDVRMIVLDNNQFTGTIPTLLGKLDDVTHLTLSHNNLNGPIPTELGECFRLTHLELNSNKLRGNIPDHLGNLDSLETLHLEGNDLIGTMPPKICSLRSGDLTDLTSDCGKTSGKVDCECCTECME